MMRAHHVTYGSRRTPGDADGDRLDGQVLPLLPSAGSAWVRRPDRPCRLTAAATCAFAGAAFVLGRRAIIEIPKALIALTTFALLSRVRRKPAPLVILGAGVIGFIVRSYYT